MRRVRAMSTVITGYVLVILVLTMLLGVGLFTQLAHRMLTDHTERLALAVAQSVAADPAVPAAVAGQDRSGTVQRLAEAARR